MNAVKLLFTCIGSLLFLHCFAGKKKIALIVHLKIANIIYKQYLLLKFHTIQTELIVQLF